MSNTPWVAVIIFLIFHTILIGHVISFWLVVTKRVSSETAALLLGPMYLILKRRNFELSRREIVLGIALYALMLLAPPVLYFIS